MHIIENLTDALLALFDACPCELSDRSNELVELVAEGRLDAMAIRQQAQNAINVYQAVLTHPEFIAVITTAEVRNTFA